MTTHSTRRHFLMSAAAAGLGTGLARSDQPVPRSERLRVGAIGIAGQGQSDLNAIAAANTEIVALCDVHESRKEVIDMRKRFDKAKFYVDFRKMIDAKGLDAVLVATPDHTHGLPTLAALRAGLHVFCEKPLTHTVEEARLVAETARKMKVVTQMGTQIHAGDNYRRVVELIQTGAIGDVAEVHGWCGTAWGGGERPRETPPIPTGLHYDLWLGPAPDRPYHPTYIPFFWRRWWDFGGGSLNDMACHHLDLAFWALKLRHPTRIEAQGPPPHPETAPLAHVIRYEFPARDKLPAVKLTWYDEGERPRLFAEGKLPAWGDGVLFVGSKGMLLSNYSEHRLLPEKTFKDFARPKPFLARSIGHYREWVEACRTGGTTTCNFDYAGALTETVLLGTVAYRLGKPIVWDAEKLQANEPGAKRFLSKEYRKPWSLS
jgi:predicted dehydrogenase